MKTAIIIGAGPAGLTAAYELLKNTEIKPIILEKELFTGGISRTVNYKGNRIDIGGHRFFSKSDEVMDWWKKIMPVEDNSNKNQNNIMLIRQRRSRIYFLRKFFDYPIKLSIDTLKKLGIVRVAKIGFSYLKVLFIKIKPEKSLEDFFINRFGKELYLTFFKSYTEKLWGVPVNEISPDWGAQRVKGLSIISTIIHFLKTLFPFHKNSDISQKDTETSLIEQFLYPKFGPGQLWEEVEKRILQMGGKIYHNMDVIELFIEQKNVKKVIAVNHLNNEKISFNGDYFISTMPVKELINKIQIDVPQNIKNISDGLQYRDFITVGLLLKELKIKDPGNTLIKDNWIYIQEPDVLVGRLQIFNNWSPYMVSDPKKIWVGMEYFCNTTDKLWKMDENELTKLGISELSKIDIIEKEDVLDSIVIKTEKAYPAYFGTYINFDKVKEYLNQFDNLFLIGRNGMHRYNNQDHSMLTAMVAVENIKGGLKDKNNIWNVNTEKSYHEKK